MLRPRELAVLFVLTLVALAGPFASSWADGPEIRWDRVIGANPSKLSSEQRQRVQKIVRREFCYHGCSRSIAQCLAEERPERTARRLAGYVIRQVVADRPDREISDGIRDRALSAHPLQLANIDLDGVDCFGAEDAAVVVVEYGDFECPFCRAIAPSLHRVVEAMQPNARLCFKHYPVRGHDHALPTSMAALAAARQGRFWPMHDALYASAPDLDDDDIVGCAKQLRLNMRQWNQDRQDAALRARIAREKLEGLRNGVSGTPTFFVNRKQYQGRLTATELRDRLEEELDLVQGRQ